MTLTGGSEPVLSPLASPINDILGLSVDATYLAHLVTSYPFLWCAVNATASSCHEPKANGSSKDGQTPTERAALTPNLLAAQTDVEDWLGAGLPGRFLEAAGDAEQGRLSSLLGAYVEGIVRNPDPMPDEVGDLPTLATWALEQLLHRRRIAVCGCQLCWRPWIVPERYPQVFCQRPRPGRSQSCHESARERAWGKANAPWRREYKKLHERVRTDTLSDELFTAWKSENNAASWVPFDDWMSKKC